MQTAVQDRLFHLGCLPGHFDNALIGFLRALLIEHRDQVGHRQHGHHNQNPAEAPVKLAANSFADSHLCYLHAPTPPGTASCCVVPRSAPNRSRRSMPSWASEVRADTRPERSANKMQCQCHAPQVLARLALRSVNRLKTKMLSRDWRADLRQFRRRRAVPKQEEASIWSHRETEEGVLSLVHRVPFVIDSK